MDLKKQAISGAKWTTISTIVIAIVQISRLSILTRFLDKSDFGIVAILTFVLGLTNTFADLGFSAAIMHKQDLSERQFLGLYWIQLAFFFILFLLCSILAPLVSYFYDEPSITYLLPIALIDLIANGIGRLYDTVLQKKFMFRTIAVRNIVSALLSIIVAIILAFSGYGIYSMILSTLFNTIMLNIWNLIYGQKYYKLRFYVSIRECLPLVKIGIYQTGSQILDYIAAKFDVLIIGKLLGTEVLGVYNLAKELVLKVIQLVNSIANKVILPILANIQNDEVVLRDTYCNVIKLLSKINFPISAAICILATPLVSVLYGSGFEEVGELMSILSIWSLFICIGNPVGSIAIATGKTNISFYYTIVRVILTAPIVCLTSLISIEAVAWGNVVLGLILFVIGWRMLLYKMIKLSFGAYTKSFIGELVVVVIAACFTYILKEHLSVFCVDNALLQLLVYGSVLLVIYVILEYLVFRNFYIIQQIMNK